MSFDISQSNVVSSDQYAYFIESQKKAEIVKVETDHTSPIVYLQKLKNSEAEQKSKDELQQEIFISKETVVRIQTCMKNILKCTEGSGIEFFDSDRAHRIFALDLAPALVFKMNKPDDSDFLESSCKCSMKARYQAMVYAQEVVHSHQLGLLVIPQAKLFTVNFEGKDYEIIAEQRLGISPDLEIQEQEFQDYADSLNEAIRQLAIFICKTGYNDVEWRNNPVLSNSLDGNGNRKIALIDIESMDSSIEGLFGKMYCTIQKSRGLVRCVNEEQGKIIESVAKQNGIDTSDFVEASHRRKEELIGNRKFKEYYAAKKFVTGGELVQVDESTLNFSTYPNKTKELQALTHIVLKEINDQISQSPPLDSVKKRRFIGINTLSGIFGEMSRKLINESISAMSYKTDAEFNKATYLGHVMTKLVELGAIFKIVDVTGRGYFIQA